MGINLLSTEELSKPGEEIPRKEKRLIMGRFSFRCLVQAPPP
jgi:hypothetical protein